MPDASVIAAQRKLEAELEELASNMLNVSFPLLYIAKNLLVRSAISIIQAWIQ